jgi:hypothetical protein
MAASRHVFTIGYVARMLGGRESGIRNCDAHGAGRRLSSRRGYQGIENLKELLDDLNET